MVSAALLGLLFAQSPPAGAAAPSQEIAAGVHLLGSSARFDAANMGWVELREHVIIVGAPHPEMAARCLEEARRTARKPVKAIILTHVRRGEVDAVRSLAREDIIIVAPAEAAAALREALAPPPGAAARPPGPRLQEVAGRLEMGDGEKRIEVLGLGSAAGPGNAVVRIGDNAVLFTGELCVRGPRAELARSHTGLWLDALERLDALPARVVVPGFGSAGGREVLDRQRRYLAELRRQVGYAIAQALPLEEVRLQVRIAPEWLVWMPYDHPSAEDIDHLYRELTVPEAPYGRRPFLSGDSRPRALALIGDRFHDPAHLEAGLRLALERAGVAARFTVDVRALNAESLRAASLLVILRDGMTWPAGPEKPHVVWMAPEQERAVIEFVERGGGFLALHNSTGLYPEGGPYLKLLGGRYDGHGPLERFRVSVVDREHPVTRGVSEYWIADEQHTPIPDPGTVRVLLESRSDEGVTAPAGWVSERGKGRVCYLANGHTREALVHPDYQSLMANAARWCLRLDGIR